jgi:hypothetical protein
MNLLYFVKLAGEVSRYIKNDMEKYFKLIFNFFNKTLFNPANYYYICRDQQLGDWIYGEKW